MLERSRFSAAALLAAALMLASGCASHSGPAPAASTSGSGARGANAAPMTAADYVRSGDTDLAAGRLDDAEGQYRLALQADSTNQAALAGLGQVAVARGDYAQALPLLQRATQVSSQLVAAFRSLGDAYAATGNLSGAVVAYRQAVALSPADLDLRLTLARVLVQIADYDEAADVCKGAIRVAKGNPSDLARAYRQLGEVYAAGGRAPESMAALYKAAELAPRDDETARSLAASAARAGLYAEAAAAYVRLLQLAPLDVDAKRQLAWVNFKLERYSVAIKDYEAIGDSLGSVDRYYLAQSYAKTEKVDRAVELFREIARADPKSYRGVYCNMAYAYYDASRYQRAIEAAREGLASDSTSACLRFCWAQALDKLGRHQEAIPMFESVLNDPAYAEPAQRELERQRRIVRLLQTKE